MIESIMPQPQDDTESDAAAAQKDVLAFLEDPATHGLSETVTRIDTHASVVFLAGRDVYKVKRAVRFSFMDLSTLAKRQAMCEAEVAINRRYAPTLYLDTVPIVRRGGRLHLGGDGDAVEWAVHLRRFDETMTLDRVADRGALDADLIARLAVEVLAAHAAAEIRDGDRGTQALADVVDETVTTILDQHTVFQRPAAEKLAHGMRRAFAEVRPLLAARGRSSWVRRCHGDLHLRNVVLINGSPALFDAIEFDEAIATTDILYDLAFLLMDLWERGFPGFANLLLNRYLWRVGDIVATLEGLAALPLFLSLRAAVRAKVEALRYAEAGHRRDACDDARRYFEAALTFLSPSPPRLVAIGGLSGTGKTTLASRLAPALGRAPGAVHVRSDIERKRLMGVDDLDRLPASAYRAEISDEVFATLRNLASAALRAGQSVIVDGVHQVAADRQALAALATRVGADFTGFWLEAPPRVMIERVAARMSDASDATEEIVRRQVARAAPVADWTPLDTARPIDDVVKAAGYVLGIRAPDLETDQH